MCCVSARRLVAVTAKVKRCALRTVQSERRVAEYGPTIYTPEPTGLGVEPRSQWPAVVRGRPIDELRPGSATHAKVLEYLLSRLDHSEREMARFFSRGRG